MKVILLQDVPQVGQRFDVKEVSDGHALNRLIPRGLAELATPEKLKRVKIMISKAEVEQVAANESFTEAVDVLSDRTLNIAVKVNEQGHLFKAIRVEEIVAAAKEEGVVLKPNQIIIEEPIKEVGEHTVTLKSGKQGGIAKLDIVAF